MSLRIIRRQYVFLTVSLVLASLLAASIVIVQNDWRAFHKNIAREYPRSSWPKIFFRQAFNAVSTNLFASHDTGLPLVKIYVDAPAQSRLLESPPESSKEWQKAFVLGPKDRLERIKVRLRGDNPRNWLFAKKSWRIKHRKKRLLDRQRVFNYLVPETASLITEHLAMIGAREAGLVAPKSRLVEIYINEVSSGVATEYEHFDESFLRNRNIMPVNLYKGEQINDEVFLGVSRDLFNSSALWTRQADDNQFAKNDFQDIKYLFELVNSAIVDKKTFAALKRVAPIKDWALFDAYRTVVGNYYANPSHNQRLLADGWRGVVLPIVHSDGGIMKPKTLEESHGRIMDVYLQDSEYLASRYQQIYELVFKQGLIDKLLVTITDLEGMLFKSVERDQSLIADIYWKDFPTKTPLDQHKIYVEELKEQLHSRKNWLRSLLMQAPSAEVAITGRHVSLTVSGSIPIHKLEILLDTETKSRLDIYWDRNNNGLIDREDYLLPSKSDGKNTIIDAMFFANRQIIAGKNEFTDQSFRPAVRTVPTTFKLIASQNMSLARVNAFNAFSDKMTPIIFGDNIGAEPSTYNIPVFSETALQSTEIWSEERQIIGNVIVRHPVEVAAGTRILLAPGASLVFENKLTMRGTREKPIEVTQSNPDLPWRVFALVGEQSSGSEIDHVNFSGGSGGRVENRNYTAMFSIHGVTDVIISNSSFRNAHQFDDVIHVVYGSGIIIDTPIIENALSDAIDIDISSVEIHNPQIVGAGNDGIDFMESVGLVIGGTISSSGDKGISVGEESDVLVYDSILLNNNIGLESKDASSAIIVRSVLKHNKTQLSAYAKNWRYGTGGYIGLSHSVIVGEENNINLEKRSRVELFNSITSPILPKNKRMTVTNAQAFGSKAAIPNLPYPERALKALEYWKLTPNSSASR